MEPIALILRHGETPPNKRHLLKGLMDPPLDPEGIEQVREAAAFLAKFPIQRQFCSPLLRTYQAALIVADVIGVWPIQTRELFPWDVGTDFMDKPKEGSGLDEFVENPGKTPKNGESLKDLCKRLHAFFSAELAKDVLTLYVTHNSVITALGDLLNDTENRKGFHPIMHSMVKPGGVVGIFLKDGAYEMQPLFGELDGEKYASS